MLLKPYLSSFPPTKYFKKYGSGSKTLLLSTIVRDYSLETFLPQFKHSESCDSHYSKFVHKRIKDDEVSTVDHVIVRYVCVSRHLLSNRLIQLPAAHFYFHPRLTKILWLKFSFCYCIHKNFSSRRVQYRCEASTIFPLI